MTPKSGATFNQNAYGICSIVNDQNDCPGFVYRQDGTNELSAALSAQEIYHLYILKSSGGSIFGLYLIDTNNGTK